MSPQITSTGLPDVQVRTFDRRNFVTIMAMGGVIEYQRGGIVEGQDRIGREK